MNLEELNTKELDAQKRLTQLYKEEASETAQKLENVEAALVSMQKLLNEGQHRKLSHLFKFSF